MVGHSSLSDGYLDADTAARTSQACLLKGRPIEKDWLLFRHYSAVRLERSKHVQDGKKNKNAQQPQRPSSIRTRPLRISERSRPLELKFKTFPLGAFHLILALPWLA
jgi:hypothetical protein